MAGTAPERLRTGCRTSGWAGAPWGAFGSCPGAFRSSEIGSQSPLSDRFGGIFDFKAGRWHCGAHAMAENTESHETCSTLSTNGPDVCI